jgi:hypothetical protein
MKALMRRVWPSILVGSMVLLLPAPVRAQQVATSFEELGSRIKPGDTIYVTDVAGVTSKGTLAGLSPLQLRVRLNESVPPLALLERDVNNIVVKRFDPLWNGMLTGFVAGAAPVALIGLGASASAGEVAGVAAGYGGIGLITGLLIDILNKKHETIYVHTQGRGSSGLHILPQVLKSGIGIQMSLQY